LNSSNLPADLLKLSEPEFSLFELSVFKIMETDLSLFEADEE